MPYNPQIHHRRSIRLKGYDYSRAGAYFITMCCEDRGCRFGEIKNRQMILNEYGKIAYHEWETLTERFANFELDVFQIMPNHIHGIIVLHDVSDLVGAGFTPAQNNITDAQIDAMARNDDSQNGQPKNNTGQPRGLPLRNITGNDNGATARIPTVGDIVGAYKSLVFNGCLGIYKSKNEIMGKFWQRNYHEHIIRNEQSYKTISEYIIHNPKKWIEDKFYKS